MSKVWVDDRCPVCKKVVEERGVLAAFVKVTPEGTYACYKPRKRVVRPLFGAERKPRTTRVLYHRECFPGVEGFDGTAGG